jgi:hypothetical protein
MKWPTAMTRSRRIRRGGCGACATKNAALEIQRRQLAHNLRTINAQQEALRKLEQDLGATRSDASTVSTPQSAGSPGDELRAHYGCAELARHGLDAVPAHDENGHPTGLVAVDPDAFSDWLEDLYEGDD